MTKLKAFYATIKMTKSFVKTSYSDIVTKHPSSKVDFLLGVLPAWFRFSKLTYKDFKSKIEDSIMLDHYTVKKLALVLAVQAEIEGMKAANSFDGQIGRAIDFGQKDFNSKANELENLAHANDDQL